MSVCSGVASVRPGAKGTSIGVPASRAAFSMAAAPPSTITSANETFLLPELKFSWTFCRAASTLASSVGSFTAQSFWGASRMRAPFAPPRMSVSRYEAAEAQAVRTSSGTVRPVARICFFSAVASASLMRAPSTGGTGSCQISASSGTSSPR